jgi:hypothetical protein
MPDREKQIQEMAEIREQIVQKDVERMGHFRVVRDWTITLKNGKSYEIDAQIIKTIVEHENKEAGYHRTELTKQQIKDACGDDYTTTNQIARNKDKYATDKVRKLTIPDLSPNPCDEELVEKLQKIGLTTNHYTPLSEHLGIGHRHLTKHGASYILSQLAPIIEARKEKSRQESFDEGIKKTMDAGKL